MLWQLSMLSKMQGLIVTQESATRGRTKVKCNTCLCNPPCHNLVMSCLKTLCHNNNMRSIFSYSRKMHDVTFTKGKNTFLYKVHQCMKYVSIFSSAKNKLDLEGTNFIV